MKKINTPPSEQNVINEKQINTLPSEQNVIN
jgi:hypothetical protein